jgi:hypothetical protein
MRKLTKVSPPQSLIDNATQWLADLKANPKSSVRLKYRQADVKEALMRETHSKCAYCESKIGHTSYGDVEHKKPTATNVDLHFEWTNMTLACGICNTLKSAYDDPSSPFLDPYSDDVEDLVVHLGPIALWKLGEGAAEVTVRMLQLNSMDRKELFARKTEKINELNNYCERFNEMQPGAVRDTLKKVIDAMAGPKAEFSAMVASVMKYMELQP